MPAAARPDAAVAAYDEISTVVLNHLEPDHSGALPELLGRAEARAIDMAALA